MDLGRHNAGARVALDQPRTVHDDKGKQRRRLAH